MSVEELFWSQVDRSVPDDCWPWAGKRDRHNYGYFYVKSDKKTMGAHRWAWKFAVGAIPEGMFVCHRCDNPPCCNPAHLFVGSHKANTADMLAKGRQSRGPRPRRTRVQPNHDLAV